MYNIIWLVVMIVNMTIVIIIAANLYQDTTLIAFQVSPEVACTSHDKPTMHSTVSFSYVYVLSTDMHKSEMKRALYGTQNDTC